MRRILIVCTFLICIAGTVYAAELTAPEVPADAYSFMPEEPQTLGQGIWAVFQKGVAYFQPDLKEAAGSCACIVALGLLTAVLQSTSEMSKRMVTVASGVSIGLIMLRAANSLLRLGLRTVEALSEYGKLLFPVLAAALAAQGGVTSSSQLYIGTIAFDAVLSGIINRLLPPVIYLFICFAIGESVSAEPMLKRLGEQLKKWMDWVLRTGMLIFSGYISITGVISGTTDSAAVKAAKLAISGVVPVVGGILSDASESVLVSAASVKNSIGIYGFFAILAIWIRPFIRIGAHYLVFRLSATVCSGFGSDPVTTLTEKIASVMGLILSMTSCTCIMLIISIVCFLRGMV